MEIATGHGLVTCNHTSDTDSGYAASGFNPNAAAAAVWCLSYV